MEKLSHTSAIKQFDNQAAWYVFDLRAAYQNNGEFYEALKKELGEDFDTRLNNGDLLFVGILPTYHKIRVYAGDPQKPNTMVYPDWEYDKLEEKNMD